MSKNSYSETKKTLEKMRVKRAEFIANQIAKIDKNDVLFDMSDKELTAVLKDFILSLSDSKKIDKNEVKKQAENDVKNNENMVANNPYNYDEMEDFRSCNEHSYLPEDDVDDMTANS